MHFLENNMRTGQEFCANRTEIIINFTSISICGLTSTKVVKKTKKNRRKSSMEIYNHIKVRVLKFRIYSRFDHHLIYLVSLQTYCTYDLTQNKLSRSQHMRWLTYTWLHCDDRRESIWEIRLLAEVSVSIPQVCLCRVESVSASSSQHFPPKKCCVKLHNGKGG